MKQNKETEKLSQHEDTALKVVSEFFRDEILPALQIEGKVVGSMATENIHLELKKGYEDFNFLMEDDSVKHFEFQSTNEGKRGLKRFRMYEAHMSYHHNKEVTTYVMFSGNIKNPMTEFTEGINTYRVHGIILQDKDADEIIQKLKTMTNSGIPLTKADLLPLVLCPLMGGQMSQKDRIVAAYDITRNALGVDKEVIRKVEAVIYIMADKFLETTEMKQLKEELKLTRLGQVLYADWKAEGIAEGQRCYLLSQIRKKINKGKSPEVIAEEVEESMETVIAFIREISEVPCD